MYEPQIINLLYKVPKTLIKLSVMTKCPRQELFNTCWSVSIFVNTFQLSRILRETHAFELFLTLTRIDCIFSCKSKKKLKCIIYLFFVLTRLLASQYLYLAESIAITIKQSTFIILYSSYVTRVNYMSYSHW